MKRQTYFRVSQILIHQKYNVMISREKPTCLHLQCGLVLIVHEIRSISYNLGFRL
ncbi:hypothetical protein I3842_12G082500 [Carya illinoinensis]|uniref:Uncharacterized protein n=1 Tax=Carya illinoinensis TaxID=32201 RepID=A0A922DI61_CARIL|nr:hypothetical protein I3842_12G082500 [Carya illinoinensis]